MRATLDRWHRILEVNLTSVYTCSREVIPHMIAAGGGSIVNTASVQGLYGFPSYSAYATTKTSSVRGPCTPSTRSSSMSEVADGPDTNVIGRPSAAASASAAIASGTVATMSAASTTHA